MDQEENLVIHERTKEEYIIDTDYHLHLPAEKIYPYIEDDQIRNKVENYGVPTPSSRGGFQTGGKYAHEVVNPGPYSQLGPVHHGAAINREEIVASKDELGTDVVIVQPGTHLPFQINTKYPVLGNALARAYNDYLIDKVLDVNEGVYGALVVPNWDVEFGLEELDRLGDHEGFVAVQNWMNCGKYWGHPDFDPLFEKMTDLDLPLILHVGGGGADGPDGDNWQVFAELIVSGLGYDLIANAASMVLTGVFDKYPDLDVMFQETGTNWIPYLAYRMDEQYQTSPEDLWLTKRMYDRDQTYLERMPSEYVFDNIYTATQPITLPNIKSRRQTEAILTASQAEKTFMYSSDWPHITVDPARWVFETPGISEELQRRILHENAEEVLRLP